MRKLARAFTVSAVLLVSVGSLAQAQQRGTPRASPVGRWTADGDCRHWVDIRSNGHYSGPTTAGEWGDERDYAGADFYMQPESYGASATTMYGRVLADGSLEIGADGERERWTRCPAPTRPTRARNRRR